MSLAVAYVSMPAGAARAVMIGTDAAIAPAAQPDARARVESFIAREDVARQLVELGIEPGEAMARLAALSEQDVERIGAQLEMMPAGEGAIGAVVGAAVLIFFVLLVTDLLGLTDVYPFVRK